MLSQWIQWDSQQQVTSHRMEESLDFATHKFNPISTFQAKQFHLTKTKLCGRSDYTTPRAFLISAGGFFCLFSSNNQPEAFQSSFPSSFLWVLPSGPFHGSADIPRAIPCIPASERFLRFLRAFLNSVPLCHVIDGICHRPLPKRLVRIQKMGKIWTSELPGGKITALLCTSRGCDSQVFFFPGQPFFLRKFPF